MRTILTISLIDTRLSTSLIGDKIRKVEEATGNSEEKFISYNNDKPLCFLTQMKRGEIII